MKDFMIASEEDLKKLTGIIYLIKNRLNNKVYIGQTIHSFHNRYGRKKRWWEIPSANKYLKNSIDKYGIDNFEIYVLEFNKNIEELNVLEQSYILKYKSTNPKYGYNLRDGGENQSFSSQFVRDIRKKRGLTLEQFIEKSIFIHKNKYDYTKSKYINFNTKLEIKCNKCLTQFSQRPHDHLDGHGCKNCARNDSSFNKSRINASLIINRAKLIHGNNYIYNFDKELYRRMSHKIEITHVKCNRQFKQRLSDHIRGHGCPWCSKRKK